MPIVDVCWVGDLPADADALVPRLADVIGDALTAALARASGRPAERVHLEYAPAGAGRIAFGGRLIG